MFVGLRRTIPTILAGQREFELSEEENGLQLRLTKLREVGPFRLDHNADLGLARMCFLVCRALKADIVVETGVAYGVTSSFVLGALARNGRGQLWSIDLPPLAEHADSYVGYLVPEHLKMSWHPIRGHARRLLPPLLRSLKSLDIFIHDSLHTYEHMAFEFKVSWEHLRPGGALIADDVERNCAFQDFARSVRSTYAAVVRDIEAKSSFGILLKP